MTATAPVDVDLALRVILDGSAVNLQRAAEIAVAAVLGLRGELADALRQVAVGVAAREALKVRLEQVAAHAAENADELRQLRLMRERLEEAQRRGLLPVDLLRVNHILKAARR